MPLIVLTADRPPELREVGAGQAIDQIKLYGRRVKWFVEVGTHPPGRDTAIHHRALGCRAYWTAAGGRPGPGAPQRRRCASRSRPRSRTFTPTDWAGRADGRPWTELREHASAPHADDVHALAARIASTSRGAIVCGPGAEDVAEPAARLAAATGWPLLAEPTSGVRCGEHDRSHVVAHYDVLLRVERIRVRARARARPARRRHAHLEAAARLARGRAAGGDRPARRLARADAACGADPRVRRRADSRRARVRRRDAQRRARPRLALVLARRGRARAGRARGVARRLRAQADRGARAASCPSEALLWVSSSMPIRDVEAYSPAVGQAHARARQSRRQRHRRRRVVGARRRDRDAACPPGS